MSFAATFKKSAFALAGFASVFAGATSAYALDAKQCGTVQEMTAALQAESQYEVAAGIRATLGDPYNIFTSNQEQTLGYNLEVGTGKQADLMCVKAKYTDIRFNRNADLSRPSWASFGNNSPFDGWLARSEARTNEKVLMRATGLVKKVDGSEVRGAFLFLTRGKGVVAGDTSSGAFSVVKQDGSDSGTLFNMANVNTNANFKAFANRPVRTVAQAPVETEQARAATSIAQRLAQMEGQCNEGNGRVCGQLSDLYNGMRDNVPRNIKKSFEFAQKGCNLNDAMACLQLGLSYDMGIGAPKNVKLAIQAYRKANMFDPDRNEPISLVSGAAQSALRRLGVTP